MVSTNPVACVSRWVGRGGGGGGRDMVVEARAKDRVYSQRPGRVWGRVGDRDKRLQVWNRALVGGSGMQCRCPMCSSTHVHTAPPFCIPHPGPPYGGHVAGGSEHRAPAPALVGDFVVASHMALPDPWVVAPLAPLAAPDVCLENALVVHRGGVCPSTSYCVSYRGSYRVCFVFLRIPSSPTCHDPRAAPPVLEGCGRGSRRGSSRSKTSSRGTGCQAGGGPCGVGGGKDQEAAGGGSLEVACSIPPLRTKSGTPMCTRLLRLWVGHARAHHRLLC